MVHLLLIFLLNVDVRGSGGAENSDQILRGARTDPYRNAEENAVNGQAYECFQNINLQVALKIF